MKNICIFVYLDYYNEGEETSGIKQILMRLLCFFVSCFNHVRHTGDPFYGSFKWCVEINENVFNLQTSFSHLSEVDNYYYKWVFFLSCTSRKKSKCRFFSFWADKVFYYWPLHCVNELKGEKFNCCWSWFFIYKRHFLRLFDAKVFF